MTTEKRLKGYDPITLESFTRHMTKHREPYDQYDMGYVDAVEQIENFLEYNTVDAMAVDKYNIKLHHILIDNEGVPEVKLQIGDRYFILRTDPVDVREVVHGQWEEWWPGITMIMTGEEMLYRCSVCDAKYPNIEGYRYCPRCGAKMDGDGNGT